MKILAVDTSMEACSVALYTEQELIERFEITPRKHIELLAPMVRSVMEEAEIQLSDLTGLAFGAGPGSFAGLRVACAFIQGLSNALNIPIIPVSSLLAMNYPIAILNPETLVLTAIDAKMNSLYFNGYVSNAEQTTRVFEDQILNMTNPFPYVDAIENSPILVGNGWNLVPEWIEQLHPIEVHHNAYPRAGEIATLALNDFKNGLSLQANEVSPFYLRNNIALTIAEQKSQKNVTY